MSQTLSGAACSDLMVRKSRFVGCVQPVADRAEALSVIADLRRQHPDATHVCWALLAGGQSAAVDDGEPGGTAGRPMLEVLRHHDLQNVMASVVRYFGGIKLGAGGLVRAYTDCVAQALTQAVKVPLVHIVHWRCVVPYALEGLLRREVAAAQGVLLDVQHGAQVTAIFSVAQDRAASLETRLMDAGRGQVQLDAIDE